MKRPDYGSNIPEARARLSALAEQMRRDGIGTYAEKIENEVLPLMTRRPAVRKAPIKKNPVTPHIIAEIRRLARTTSLYNDEIAGRVGVNPGRVSEVINGLRK